MQAKIFLGNTLLYIYDDIESFLALLIMKINICLGLVAYRVCHTNHTGHAMIYVSQQHCYSFIWTRVTLQV